MYKAVILPPLGVFFERGCVCDLLINIALTCLGYIPGISKYLKYQFERREMCVLIYKLKISSCSLHHSKILTH